EVGKLAERNASEVSRLQKVQNQSDALLPLEVRQAYDGALEAQQRLFLMRGQVDKLNSDKKNLENLVSTLVSVTELLGDSSQIPKGGADKETFSMIEAIIQAQEAERQRMSRQMHDGPAQALSNFILQSEIAMRLFDVDQDQAREELVSLKMAATSAFQQVRNFVFELRPMMLDDLGLIPTLKRYSEAFKDQTAVEVELKISGLERRLESYIEVIIFRSLQDLLGFAHREGAATKITISMNIGENNVKISMDDNGKGFDVEEVFKGSGISIKAIKDRIEMLGGFMEVESTGGNGGYYNFQIPVSATSQSVFTEL
ncbi:MAG: sensor histidine kinase, partial [Anaerolineales bacterium]|nr:sensor histidine kinase [Anaerolineales bacterium]